MYALLVVLLWLILIIFWVSTFYSLMAMPDSAFKGRNDKLIWAVLVIVLNLFGALVFHYWRLTQRTEDLIGKEVVEILDSAAKDSD